MTDKMFGQNGTIDENGDEEEFLPIDCIIRTEVSTGGYDAKVIAYPPVNGGAPLSEELIINALSEAGVVHGLIEEIIKKMVATRNYNSWQMVATHTPPENGEDGYVKYLLEKTVTGKLSEDARGFVDYKNLNIIRNIMAGTVIGEIVYETLGTPGTNVLNEPIKQIEGKPPKIDLGENVVVNEEKTQLVAKENGNLVFSGGRFHVRQAFKMDGDIDISTGNIDFIGDIIIRGDIKEGFKVKSDKSVTVYGSVYGSEVIAEESIIIKNGAIGSKIIAGGKVELDFAENVTIRCTESLKVNSLYFCDVYCRGEVNLSGRNGSVIGGQLVCTKSLSAISIGARSYTPTNIIVGDNAILLEEKSRMDKRINELTVEVDKCNKIITFLNFKKEEMKTLPADKEAILSAAAKTILVASAENAKLIAQIEQIDLQLQTKQNLYVNCRKDLNPGVKIIINDSIFIANTLYQHCQVGLGKEGIEVRTL